MRTNGTDTFIIASPRLEVELARPGSSVQKGARFDLTGHVVQATLDGKHVFCAPEDFDSGRGSGGLGLCNEFMDASRAMYDEAALGEPFPKIGVGLVTRDTEEYFFMKHYDKAPYPVEVEAGAASARFEMNCVDCRGFAAGLVKTLSVDINALRVEYELQNTGSRPLDLLEYNHNFVCIDGKEVGPDYRMRLPYGVSLDRQSDALEACGNEILWKRVPEGAFFCLPAGYAGCVPHRWELVHAPSGVGMRETGDFPVDHLALWGKSHVVSMEVFIKIFLNPGEMKRWSRTYEFFSK